jgi:hypothetical protein
VSAPGPAACPHCGAATRPGARFCRSCGRPLAGAGQAGADDAGAGADQAGLGATGVAAGGAGQAGVGATGVAAGGAGAGPAGDDVLPAADSARQRRRLRLRLLIGGVLVLALAAAWGVANASDRALHAPDRSVRALFAALAAKDVAAVRAVTTCRYGPLCEPGALGSGYEPPTGLRIRDVRYGGTGRDGEPTRLPDRTRATVLVRYTMGGRSFDDAVALHRAGWFDDWSITAAPGWPLVLDTARVPQVRVAAATVTGKAWALPGVYTVAVAGDALYAADPLTLTVGGAAQETRISPAVRLRDDLAAEVDRQVRQRIDACAAQETLRPDTDPAPLGGRDCPFSAPQRYTITRNVRWRIARYPRLALAMGDGRPVSVRTVAEGEAVVAYEWSTDILEPRRWTPFSEPAAFSVAGRADTGDDGKVVWTP